MKKRSVEILDELGSWQSVEYYLAADVDARIASLETRLIDCEKAVMMCNRNAMLEYMNKYPDPYIPN